MSRFLKFAGLLLFFLMVFLPTSYQPIKAGLLGMILMAAGVTLVLHRRLSLHRSVVAWTLFLMTIGLGFILLGTVRSAPGAVRVASVYVLWPLVFLILISYLKTYQDLMSVLKIMLASAILIPLYAASYILYELHLIPTAFYLALDQGQAIGFYKGYVEINLYSLSSLLFLFPFSVSALLTWPKAGALPFQKKWLWLASILGGALVLVSGRRALLLVGALSPFLTLAFRFTLPAWREQLRAKARPIFTLGAILVVIVVTAALLHLALDVESGELITYFIKGFDFSTDPSANPRREQFYALLEGWKQSPLFGNGLGSFTTFSVRSFEMPWAYELYYMSLLFQTGIVGVLCYALGIFWIIWSSIRILREDELLAPFQLSILVGMLCFLIGNATNPYLVKFDYMWVIFLPLAFINFWKLQKKNV